MADQQARTEATKGSGTPRERTRLNEYFDDLAIGDYFVTPARAITQEDINIYSELSGDSHPLHTDEKVARENIFGALTAQGCLTLSIATGLEYSLIGPDVGGIIAFSGMDKVRFVKPVFLGDTIHIEGKVVEMEIRDEHRGLVVVHQEVKNQHGETVAVLDKRMLHKRRERG